MMFLTSVRKPFICISALLFSLVSIQVYGECVAVAAELSFEQDEQYDGFLLGAGGCLYDPSKYTIDNIPAVLPVTVPGKINKHTLVGVFVNGKGNTALMQFDNLQLLANTTGLPMVGVHNAARIGWGELTEMGPNSIPTRILTENILGRINAGKRIRIWSSSQGTFYVARALSQTGDQINDKTKLDKIEIITTGGAAPFWIDGPRYVHYINKQDPVPHLMGPASAFAKPGRGAVLATFDFLNNDPNDGCADGGPKKRKDAAIISWMLGKVLVKEAHIVCVHTPFFEEFDRLRSLSNSAEATTVDLPLSKSVNVSRVNLEQLRKSI